MHSKSLSLLEDVKKEFPRLGGNLQRNVGKINDHTDEKIDEITGKLNSLELIIKSVKQQTEPIGGFAHATEEWSKFRDDFPQIVKKSQEHLESKIKSQEGAIGNIYQLTKKSVEDIQNDIYRLKIDNKNLLIALVVLSILNFTVVAGLVVMYYLNF